MRGRVGVDISEAGALQRFRETVREFPLEIECTKPSFATRL
jgi:hypothetical protein